MKSDGLCVNSQSVLFTNLLDAHLHPHWCCWRLGLWQTNGTDKELGTVDGYMRFSATIS